MDYITLTIANATPSQIARAIALAENFAAHSGIQAHSGAKDHRLPLYNIILTDRLPRTRRVTPAAPTVPSYSVPTNEDGSTHPNDVGVLIAWLKRWPDTVKVIRLHVPRTGEALTIGRAGLIEALEKEYT